MTMIGCLDETPAAQDLIYSDRCLRPKIR